jgi:hypothetical protein
MPPAVSNSWARLLAVSQPAEQARLVVEDALAGESGRPAFWRGKMRCPFASPPAWDLDRRQFAGQITAAAWRTYRRRPSIYRRLPKTYRRPAIPYDRLLLTYRRLA